MTMGLPGLLGGLAGAGIGAIPMATGMGNQSYKPQTFDQSGAYNSNAFQYGGTNGGAAAQAGAYGNVADQAQGRQGIQLDGSQMNESRGSQMDALSMERDAAMGKTPSVAQMQMQGGMEDAMRSQQSMAAGARGPAAMAMAQQNAAGNTAGLQQNTAFQSSMLRAQEMAQARQAYMGGATGIRGQDFNTANANAGYGMQQRALNDARSLGYSGLQNNVNSQQLGAQQNQQQLMAQSYGQANQMNAAQAAANAANQKWQWGQIIGGAQAGMQMGGMGGGAPPAPGGGGGGGGGMGAAGGDAAGGAMGGAGGAGAAGIPPIPL